MAELESWKAENFIKKDAAEMFSCEFCEMFNHTILQII